MQLDCILTESLNAKYNLLNIGGRIVHYQTLGGLQTLRSMIFRYNFYKNSFKNPRTKDLNSKGCDIHCSMNYFITFQF